MLQFSSRFACYHVIISLLKCILKIPRVCFFWKSWVALKKAVFNAEDAQSGVPWPSHTLGVALATGQLCRRWRPETDLTRSRYETLFQLTDVSDRSHSEHAPASNLRFCSRRVQIRTVRRPQIWWDELRCLLLQELSSLTCLVCRRIVLLEHKHVACNAMHDWQHLLLQQDFTVIPAVHSHDRLDNSSEQPSFETTIETISDLETVGRQHRSHSAAISRFLTLCGTYTR